MKRAYSKTSTLIVEKRIFWCLVGVIGVLMIAYSFFLSHSIVNVVAREEMEQDITLYTSIVSDLESEYLSKKNTVTIDRAHALGYINANDHHFIARKSAISARLSLSDGI